MSRRHNVFALAARNMEKRLPIRGRDHATIYPCWYIADAAGRLFHDWSTDPDCERFLGAYSGEENMRQRSHEFICELMNVDEDQDNNNCILALCFAAAMADEGDLEPAEDV